MMKFAEVAMPRVGDCRYVVDVIFAYGASNRAWSLSATIEDELTEHEKEESIAESVEAFRELLRYAAGIGNDSRYANESESGEGDNNQ